MASCGNSDEYRPAGKDPPPLSFWRFRPRIAGGRRCCFGGWCRGGGGRGRRCRNRRAHLCRHRGRLLLEVLLCRCGSSRPQLDKDGIGGEVRRAECASSLRPHRDGLRLITGERKRRRKLRSRLHGKLAWGAAALACGGLHLRAGRLGLEPHRLCRRRRAEKVQARHRCGARGHS
jgi:hypothetical protein